MKKLKLSLQQFEGAEPLTREQLKKVVGGDWGTGEEGACTSSCWKKATEPGGEKTLLGSVETTNCDGGAGKCRDSYPDADDATCTCDA